MNLEDIVLSEINIIRERKILYNFISMWNLKFKKKSGHLGGSIGLVSAFGSGHDFGVLGLSPT